MSLEKLLEKIQADGEKKANEIIAEAEKKATKILREAELKKDALKKEYLERESAKIKQEIEGKKAILQIEARKKLLAKKQESLETVYQKAMAEITSLPTAPYQNFIEKRLFSLLEKGEYEIIVAANDKEKITKNFIEALNQKLKEKKIGLKFVSFSSSIKNGFLLKQGKVEINSSLAEILKRKRGNLDIQLGKLLFE